MSNVTATAPPAGRRPQNAPDPLFPLVTGMWSARLVQTAAELGIADVINEEPVAVTAVAESVGADPAMLRRLMRALASHGVFRPVEDDRYAHTKLSRSLRATAPGGVRHLALLAGSEWCMTVWERLNSAVRTGENPFRAHYGKDIWTYLSEDAPEAAAIFHGTMTQISGAANGPIVDALDLTDVSTIADVGGGEGSLIRSLLERHPGMEGAIVDSEAALRGADGALRADGPLASRCRLVPGDCLREVPYSADVYLFKWVLHQWDDDTCIRVLGNCAEHARPGARVIIAERTMSETPPPFVTLLDMLILLGQGGGVRTEAEFADLVERAGLRFIGVRPTASPVALIEAAITA